MSHFDKNKTAGNYWHTQFSTLRTGLLLITAGFLIYADRYGYVRDWFWWLILVWGISLLLEVIIKLSIPRFRDAVTSPLIWGTILTGFSWHQLYGWHDWWPIALIAIGTGLILKNRRGNLPS